MRALSHRLVGVDECTAGGAVVSTDELAKKLGAPAYLVWQMLCQRRDRVTGETTITNRGILRIKSFAQVVKRTTLCKALARLYTARLVEPLGYQVRRVPLGRCEVDRMVYVRRVYGAPLLRAGAGAPGECAVPTFTRAWMTTATTWGGARKGAGRPAVFKREPASDLMPENNSRGSQLDKARSNQEGASKRYKNKKEVNTGCGFSLSSESENRASPRSAQPVFESFETGTLSGGASRMAPPLGLPLAGVPRFPGNAVIEPATVPHPPLLDPNLDDATLAGLLARAYRAAIEARYGGRCWVLAKGDITRAKNYRALVAFANSLIEHEIPPAVWCIHRVDKWRKLPAATKGKRLVQPTMAYVFAPKAISDENRWQFRVEYDDGKIGGRQIFGEKHRALLERYKRMHADLAHGGMTKAAAVEKHFPGELYLDMVDAAKLEAHETRYRLEDQVKRGVFVW